MWWGGASLEGGTEPTLRRACLVFVLGFGTLHPVSVIQDVLVLQSGVSEWQKINVCLSHSDYSDSVIAAQTKTHTL